MGNPIERAGAASDPGGGVAHKSTGDPPVFRHVTLCPAAMSCRPGKHIVSADWSRRYVVAKAIVVTDACAAATATSRSTRASIVFSSSASDGTGSFLYAVQASNLSL